MATYFEEMLPTLRKGAEREAEIVEAELIADLLKTGHFGASSHWLRLEEILARAVSQYGAALEEKLLSFEVGHSPIRASDFEAAKNSLDHFAQWCNQLLEKRISKNRSYTKSSHTPFNDGHFQRTLATAKHNIEGRKSEFVSKHSFVKWALGDLRKRSWSALLILLGAGVTTLFNQLFG